MYSRAEKIASADPIGNNFEGPYSVASAESFEGASSHIDRNH